MDRTFVLGLGAPKAGTTWLYDFMNSAPECNMGTGKEYHIWDGLWIPDLDNFKVRHRELFRRRIYSDRHRMRRYLMQHVPNYYETYFLGLNSKITGDITPSYMALREIHLKKIRQRLTRAGFRVKVVFLMRDPVERCWSSARMNVRRRNDGRTVEQRLEEEFSKPGMTLRQNYHETIESIETVFSHEDVYYGIFEKMFSRTEIERLSEFLGISGELAQPDVKSNASPKITPLPNELANCIRKHYSDVYAYCGAKFPETRDLWIQPEEAD